MPGRARARGIGGPFHRAAMIATSTAAESAWPASQAPSGDHSQQPAWRELPLVRAVGIDDPGLPDVDPAAMERDRATVGRGRGAVGVAHDDPRGAGRCHIHRADALARLRALVDDRVGVEPGGIAALGESGRGPVGRDDLDPALLLILDRDHEGSAGAVGGRRARTGSRRVGLGSGRGGRARHRDDDREVIVHPVQEQCPDGDRPRDQQRQERGDRDEPHRADGRRPAGARRRGSGRLGGPTA